MRDQGSQQHVYDHRPGTERHHRDLHLGVAAFQFGDPRTNLPDPSRESLIRAKNLRVDAVGVEVLNAFDATAVDALILKGPTLRFLYENHEARAYEDFDLLVSPNQLREAQQVLRDAGFAQLYVDIPGDRPQHGYHWARDGRVPVIDLHTTLIGARAEPDVVWRLLWARRHPFSLLTVNTFALDMAARMCHVALHAAAHGRGRHGSEDLQRAINQVPVEIWIKAAIVADGLNARNAFGVGLSLVPGGDELSDALGVAVESSDREVLLRSQASSDAVGVEWLMRLSGRRRFALMWRKLVPPMAFMRVEYPQLADAHVAKIVLAYLRRSFSVIRRAVPALLVWYRSGRKQDS